MDQDLDDSTSEVMWTRYPSCYRTSNFSHYKHAVRKAPTAKVSPSYPGIPTEELAKFKVFDAYFEELLKWTKKKKDPEELKLMEAGKIDASSLQKPVSVFQMRLYCLS